MSGMYRICVRWGKESVLFRTALKTLDQHMSNILTQHVRL